MFNTGGGGVKSFKEDWKEKMSFKGGGNKLI